MANPHYLQDLSALSTTKEERCLPVHEYFIHGVVNAPGTLCRSLQRALDRADDAGRSAGAPPVHHLDVKGRLAQDPLVGAPRQVRKRRQNESTEPQWRLQRGKWIYDDGERYVPPGWDGLTAEEATAQFWKDEQAKAKTKPYRNGIAIEGRMRGWQRRNPSGGFFSEL